MPGELVTVPATGPFAPARRYQTVVFGGTFDRLHAGHRAIFATAVELVSEGGDVVIGLSGDQLLQHKQGKEVIRCYEERERRVLAELERLAGGKRFGVRVVAIQTREGTMHNTPYTDACLIVSEETREIALSINEVRGRSGLELLDIAIVPLVRDDCGAVLSSTALRQRE